MSKDRVPQRLPKEPRCTGPEVLGSLITEVHAS